jgi:hypothetical protein
MQLTREQILNAEDLPREAVEISEWGGMIWVRGLSASERDEFDLSFFEEDGKRKTRQESLKNIRARLVALTVCDVHGNRIFTDGDIDAIGRKSGKIIDRLYDVASRLSGISGRDVEILSKNLKGGQSEDSPSSLPASLASGTLTA